MSGRSMRAVRFHGAGVPLRLEDVPYPEAGPGEVVVRVAACGVCGSDLHFCDGLPTLMAPPFVLGHEPAGVIESLGEGVTQGARGDRVALHIGRGCGRCRACLSGHPTCCPSLQAPGLTIDGAFAEAVRVPESCLVRVPEGVSLDAAAVATDCVATPYHALTCRGGLARGERVAVIGAGGLGGQAVRLARALGAAQVIAIDVSSSALERAAANGATDTLLATTAEAAAARVLELADGGVDLALECVGTPETVATGAGALHPGGRLVIVGVGLAPLRFDEPQVAFIARELSVLGSFGSHARDLAEVLRLQASGVIDIDSAISHRLRLDEVASGLEMLRTKRGNPDRIVVQPAL
jgi:threonine dehydrogenase-like Zn-dependent dehydrogenase